MNLAEFSGFSGIPVVVALVEVFKTIVPDRRLWPVLALILGVLWQTSVSFALGGGNDSLFVIREVLNGIVIGLAASGLYSGVRALTKE